MTYQIVQLSDNFVGAFDVVASGLTFVDATNQAMALEWQHGEKFRAMLDGSTYSDWLVLAASGGNNKCNVQADWANL